MSKNNLFSAKPENITTFISPLKDGNYTFKLPSSAFTGEQDSVEYKKYDKVKDGETSERRIAMVSFVNTENNQSTKVAVLDAGVMESISSMSENDTVSVTVTIEDVVGTNYKRNQFTDWTFNQAEPAQDKPQ